VSAARANAGDVAAVAEEARRLVTLSDAAGSDATRGVLDSRGWPVLTPNGRAVGRVADLVLDPAGPRTRIVVIVPVTGGSGRDTTVQGEPVLVPAEFVHVDARARSVTLGGAALAVLEVLPRSDGRRITREQVALLAAVRTALGAPAIGSTRVRTADGGMAGDASTATLPPSAAGAVGDVDDDGRTRRVVLHEEQLHVAGTRLVPAGEVTVKKVVDTLPVERALSLQHDEVEIERRPGTAESPMEAVIGEDEIRIPILEERLVIEKRLVVREEVIVRRRTATRTETISDSVRRERLVTDGPVRERGTDPAIPRGPGASAAPDPPGPAR
jgi:uncharacterized protein (TIGR02271 family)